MYNLIKYSTFTKKCKLFEQSKRIFLNLSKSLYTDSDNEEKLVTKNHLNLQKNDEDVILKKFFDEKKLLKKISNQKLDLFLSNDNEIDLVVYQAKNKKKYFIVDKEKKYYHDLSSAIKQKLKISQEDVNFIFLMMNLITIYDSNNSRANRLNSLTENIDLFQNHFTDTQILSNLNFLYFDAQINKKKINLLKLVGFKKISFEYLKNFYFMFSLKISFLKRFNYIDKDFNVNTVIKNIQIDYNSRDKFEIDNFENLNLQEFLNEISSRYLKYRLKLNVNIDNVFEEGLSHLNLIEFEKTINLVEKIIGKPIYELNQKIKIKRPWYLVSLINYKDMIEIEKFLKEKNLEELLIRVLSYPQYFSDKKNLIIKVNLLLNLGLKSDQIINNYSLLQYSPQKLNKIINFWFKKFDKSFLSTQKLLQTVKNHNKLLKYSKKFKEEEIKKLNFEDFYNEAIFSSKKTTSKKLKTKESFNQNDV